MTPSPALIDFLAAWEGPPSLVPREDPVAPGVWYCGYGHTCTQHTPSITVDEALDLLVADAEIAGNAVRAMVVGELLQNEFDALTSFCFNVGSGNLAKSTLLRRVNHNDMVGASTEFMRWNHTAGKEVKGLTRRRAAEQAMFIRSDYSKRP